MTPKQSAAIESLMTGATVLATAKKVRCNPATVHRWLALPEFADALRNAQDESFRQTAAKLKSHAAAAIDALVREMGNADGTSATRVSAADRLLSQTVRYCDHLDLKTQIADLEAQVAAIRAERKGGVTP